jgi:glycosyltransferase involved in cell wall biosynthesis
MPTSSPPRVSICMPVYNGEGFVAQSLDSILAQTFGDYELHISDNASTDATADICRGYAARDARIRYQRNDVNLGPNRNFNLLVQRARGAYFKLANADDLCAPDLLAQCVTVLDREPDVILCYARTRLIDAEGNWLGDYDDNLELRSPSAVTRFINTVANKSGLVNVLQGLIRSDELRNTGLLACHPGADKILLAELALRGQFHEIPDRLFFRRLHAAASSALKTPEEQQYFVDPAAKAVRPLRLWREHMGYATAMLRTSLSLHDRMLFTYWILRIAIWDRRELRRELFNLARSSMRGPRVSGLPTRR